MASSWLVVSVPVALAVAVTGGLPVKEPQARLIGGIETNISQVPYLLALEWDGRQFCAAAIISSTFAVTASHCVQHFDPEEVIARTGSTERESGGTVIPVKSFYLNPKFKETKIDYDVAVVELTSPIEFDLNSQPIALAPGEPAPGQTAVVSGWGSVHERGTSSQQLNTIRIAIIDRAICGTSYEKIEEITDRMMCAGAPGYDSCKGDSGGPIVTDQGLIGIVSWGRGCGRPEYPGVYANLGNVEIREFVRNVTGI